MHWNVGNLDISPFSWLIPADTRILFFSFFYSFITKDRYVSSLLSLSVILSFSHISTKVFEVFLHEKQHLDIILAFRFPISFVSRRLAVFFPPLSQVILHIFLRCEVEPQTSVLVTHSHRKSDDGLQLNQDTLFNTTPWHAVFIYHTAYLFQSPFVCATEVHKIII